MHWNAHLILVFLRGRTGDMLDWIRRAELEGSRHDMISQRARCFFSSFTQATREKCLIRSTVLTLCRKMILFSAGSLAAELHHVVRDCYSEDLILKTESQPDGWNTPQQQPCKWRNSRSETECFLFHISSCIYFRVFVIACHCKSLMEVLYCKHFRFWGRIDLLSRVYHAGASKVTRCRGKLVHFLRCCGRPTFPGRRLPLDAHADEAFPWKTRKVDGSHCCC